MQQRPPPANYGYCRWRHKRLFVLWPQCVAAFLLINQSMFSWELNLAAKCKNDFNVTY